MRETIKQPNIVIDHTNLDPVINQPCSAPSFFATTGVSEYSTNKDEAIRETAADIANRDLFVIGPKVGANPDPTPLEVQRMDSFIATIPNYRQRPVATIIVGDEEKDTKIDFICPANVSRQEINAAYILDKISKFDVERADELVEPVSKELLVHKHYNSDNEVVSFIVKNDDEVKSMLATLKSFDIDCSTPYFQKLYDAIDTNYSLFKNQAQQIIKQTANEKVQSRIKQTRFKRNALRLLAVGGLAFSGVFINSSINKVQPNPRLQELTIAEENNIYYQLDNYSLINIHGNPQATSKERAIETTTLKDELTQLNETVTTTKFNPQQEHALTILADVTRLALHDSLKDKLNNSVNQLLDNLNADINNTFTVPDYLYVLLATCGLVGSAYLGNRSSKRGGRRDELVKFYRAGQLRPSDVTPSQAVNNKLQRNYYNRRK